MVNRCMQRVQDLNEVEFEVMNDCRKIQESIEAIREKIFSHITSPQNTNGCLRGVSDDYIEKFDA